ncbi:MAG: cytochrome b561 domain-containing protein [Pseudomonadota bacterium]
MVEWLAAPIDADRIHAVTWAVSWHGRIMMLGWGIIAPLAVIVARFFKVLPWQNWPTVLDSKLWWRTHWIGLSTVTVMTIAGVAFIWPFSLGGSGHALIGYTVVVLATLQIVLGIFRGTKGGPTAPAPDGSLRGDHYDMTRRRVAFELAHKTIGTLLIALALAALVLGMWEANAPRWMWLALAVWWVGLAIAVLLLQRRGYAMDTYQAIWGPDPTHPGNSRRPIGWGVKRHTVED